MPPGQGIDLVARPLGELDEVEQLLGARLRHLPGDVEVAGVHEQVLADRELRVEIVDLGHDADPGLDAGPVAGRVHAHHGQRPVGDGARAGDHPHRRGLARPVRAEEAERLADVDVEVHAVHRGERVEALGQAAGMDEDIALDGHGTADCSDACRDPARRGLGGLDSAPRRTDTTRHVVRETEFH